MSQWWSIALSIVGVGGFLLAGRRVWWAWYVNLAAQGLWLAYALVSRQYGFLLGVGVYSAVFGLNARKWTREHFARPCTCAVRLMPGAPFDHVDRAGCPRHTTTGA